MSAHVRTQAHTHTTESVNLLSQGLYVAGAGLCFKAQARLPSSLAPSMPKYLCSCNIHHTTMFILNLKNHYIHTETHMYRTFLPIFLIIEFTYEKEYIFLFLLITFKKLIN